MKVICEIGMGDKVRSFDFANGTFGYDLEGERACYVEGVILGVGDFLGQGFDQYKILCLKRIFGGKEVQPEEDYFFPPVNGTPTWMGKETQCVRLFDEN